MNFKEWEKISEDKQTVKLKHPRGHEMMIALKGLPKIQQEQIKRLKFAKGGDVEDSDDMSEQGKTVRHAKKMKARGESIDQEMMEAKDEAKGRAEFERKAVKPKMKGLANGGQVHYYDNQDDVIGQDDNAPRGDAPNAQPAAQAAPPPAVVVNNITPGAANPQTPPAGVQNPAPSPTALRMAQPQFAPSTPVEQPKMETPRTVNGSSISSEANKDLQSIEDAQTAERNQVAVTGAQAKANLPLVQQQAQASKDEATNLVNNTNLYNKDVHDVFDALLAPSKEFPNGRATINPKHYAENLGTAAKVTSAIGLFLGGMSVPFGGHNFAFDHIEKQIDRDIDAQQKTVDNQKTILGAFQSRYKDNNTAIALTKAALYENAAKQMEQTALQLATPQAQINSAKGVMALRSKEQQIIQGAAANARGSGLGNSGPQRPGTNKPPQGNGSGFEGVGGAQNGSSIRTDRVLSPDAEAKYKWAMSKYNNIQSPEEKKAIIDQYSDATQIDKQLENIDKIYPQLEDKATLGGYLADKVNPGVIGGMAATGAEALGIAGAPVTGGASALAALPAAAAAGAGGYAIGAGAKQGLRALGGQTQTQYESAAGALETSVVSALKSSGLTPSEAQEMAKKYLPTKFDSKATAQDKLMKLKEKIVSTAQTSALKAHKMTRESGR